MQIPVTWSPHPDQTEAARRHYAQWWLALDWVREEIIVERRAQAAIRNGMERSGAKIDPRKLDASMRYIKIHKDALDHFMKHGSWPNSFLRYYGLI